MAVDASYIMPPSMGHNKIEVILFCPLQRRSVVCLHLPLPRAHILDCRRWLDAVNPSTPIGKGPNETDDTP